MVKQLNMVALATALSVFVHPIGTYAGNSINLNEKIEIVTSKDGEETKTGASELLTNDEEQLETVTTEAKDLNLEGQEAVTSEGIEEATEVEILPAETEEKVIEQTPVTNEEDSKLSVKSVETAPLTADEWLEHALTQFHFHDRLALSIEGLEKFPHDVRFVDAINKSARALLNWAIRKHNEGDYGIAIDRYERILPAPAIEPKLLQDTEKHYKDALYLHAVRQFHFHDRLALSVVAYQKYPDEKRFVEAINTSAKHLLDWTVVRHADGNYPIAVDRFNRILSAPALASNIRQSATYNLGFALQEKRTPEAYYQYAIKQFHFHDRVAKFNVGFQIYSPSEQAAGRFVEGINTSAQALLNWAIGRHNQGDLVTAIDRYERILASSSINSTIRQTTEARHRDALYQFAVGQFHFHSRLILSVKGFQLYPSDVRFQQAINNSSRSLLAWATDQHQAGNFDVAINRYNLIITSDGVNNSLKAEAQSKLLLAEEGLTIDRKVIDYTPFNITLANVLNIQMNLSTPPQTDKYRNDPAFIHSSLVDVIERGVISGTTVNLRTSPDSTVTNNIHATVGQGTILVIEAEVTGNSVSGSTIWYRAQYNNNTVFVHSSLVTVSNVAVVKNTTSVRQSANSTSHNFGTITRNSELVIVKQVTGSQMNGSTVWYEVRFRTWRNATAEDVIPFLDPNNNDLFQHLLLSSSVGVSATQLNGVLQNKGTLTGKGQAFIDAAKQHSVNEVYLIAHALLETGHGTSSLATGIEVGVNKAGSLELVTANNRNDLTNIRTTYNMYGINAVDSDPYRQGAFHAYREGWFTADAAIIGGAKFIGERYIHNSFKQNTLYKMRWNPASPGWPQYATDMAWAVKQISTIKNLYNQLENPVLHFDIPQYK